MVNFVEEKALGNCQWLHSHEDELLLFSGVNCNDFNLMNDHDCGNDESDGDESDDVMERTLHWESQRSLLQEVVTHHSITGAKLRQEVLRGLQMLRKADICNCCCSTMQNSVECFSCLRRAIVNYLRDRGFNAALCTSSWKSTPNIPRGKHHFIDVMMKVHGGKQETRYIVELELHLEFKMATACKEYQMLADCIPEVYVGKLEHLNAIINIMCNAAKRSMKEKKFYMGPWRRRNFMQMKWSGPFQRNSPVGSLHEPD